MYQDLHNYKIISTLTARQVEVSENTQFNHIEAACVIVMDGVRARLYGTVTELLVIKKDAKVFVHGAVTGKIQDEGGRLYIFDV